MYKSGSFINQFSLRNYRAEMKSFTPYLSLELLINRIAAKHLYNHFPLTFCGPFKTQDLIIALNVGEFAFPCATHWNFLRRVLSKYMHKPRKLSASQFTERGV
jgi:hypothetical protein